ncbi:hypothetical protein DFH09DRAFT_1144963 [Mycena vulgaris]|nr:hypothetical protein DFH09DRAFT_1144963 [Mycena vulgaris]
MLGQAEIARYLDQCDGSMLAIEEVLSAYIVWKYLKGATSERVLLKLRYLTIYLRVTGRRHILDAGADAFKAVTMEVALAGGGRIGLLPSMTVPGRAVWNELRRASRASAFVTDSVYGGPGPVQAFSSHSQSQRFRENESRSPWLESYFVAMVARRSLSLVEAPEYTTEQERLTTLPPYASRDDTARSIMVA